MAVTPRQYWIRALKQGELKDFASEVKKLSNKDMNDLDRYAETEMRA